jgi:hypothetical protein
MKRSTKVLILLIFSVVMALAPLAWGKYGGGSGTPSSPYLIYTAQDLKAIGEDSANWGYYVHYRLMADIDLAVLDSPMRPLGDETMRFKGIIEGNGKTISNLKIEVSSGDYVGMFGYAEVEIHDLRLVNVEINAPQSTYVGALAGWTGGRNINRCCVEGGRVTGLDQVGGLIGYASTSMEQCYTVCEVSGRNDVGGLIGCKESVYDVSRCYSTATVSGNTGVGGLVGNDRGILRDCYATGQVSGTLMTGGLIGNCSSDGIVWNCYAAGTVRADGLVGGLCGSSVTCCRSFWDVQASGQSTSLSGVGKTPAQMRTASTFAGWGRSGAWTISEGVDYPSLAWENKGGSPLTTPAFPGIDGDGTAAHPYLIETVEQLNAIGDCPGEWDRHYRLESDFDLTELHEPFRIIGTRHLTFTGTFDGNGHSISNFECFSAPDGAGLFGCTWEATIRRLTLLNPRVGVSWPPFVGSLIGVQVYGVVEACGAEGGAVSGQYYVGGLVGECDRGTVTRCYSAVPVTGLGAAENIGALVGIGDRCNVNNSYATGSVSGLHNVGGLIGRTMDGGTIAQCYAVGHVTCPQDMWTLPDAGGLIGVADSPLVTACFWDTETSGFATSAAGRGMSTSQLRTAATFIDEGWDFVGETANGTADIWCIDEGVDYPRFSSGTTEPPVREWADDFADGVSAPLWIVYESPGSTVHVREINGSLELETTGATPSGHALYTSSDWMLDGTQDFFMKLDYHFSTTARGEGWVSFGLTPDAGNPFAQYVDLIAGSLDGETYFAGRQATQGEFRKWSTQRQSDSGTLYVSYNAEKDELHRSFTGYGPINAWSTSTGLVKGRWAGKPLYITLGGSSLGVMLQEGEAWLDNFVLDGGTVVP